MPFIVRQVEPIDLANKPPQFDTDNPLERVTNSTLCQENNLIVKIPRKAYLAAEFLCQI